MYAPPLVNTEEFWSVSSCTLHDEAITCVVNVKVSCSGGVTFKTKEVSRGCAVCEERG